MALASRIELAVPDAAAMSAHLRDIEAGALFLRSNANPPVGEPVEVALVLPGGAPLVVTGTVSRIDAGGFGLTLDPPSDAVRAALATAKLAAPPADLPTAIARLDALGAELHESREKVAQLQREAETNRAFYARALAQAHPKKGGGPRWDHFLSVGIGVLCGIILTLGVLVARAPAPLPPERPPRAERPITPRSPALAAVSPTGPVPVAPAPVRDAGVAAPAAAAAGPAKAPVVVPDDSALNLVATGEARVFVDGREVGRSPVRGLAVKPGEHAVRFECLSDAAGSTEQRVNVLPFADVDVEHVCP